MRFARVGGQGSRGTKQWYIDSCLVALLFCVVVAGFVCCGARYRRMKSKLEARNEHYLLSKLVAMPCFAPRRSRGRKQRAVCHIDCVISPSSRRHDACRVRPTLEKPNPDSGRAADSLVATSMHPP